MLLRPEGPKGSRSFVAPYEISFLPLTVARLIYDEKEGGFDKAGLNPREEEVKKSIAKLIIYCIRCVDDRTHFPVFVSIDSFWFRSNNFTMAFYVVVK